MKIHYIKTRPFFTDRIHDQPVDLDNIVSVSTISPISYTGYSIGKSHIDFHVYPKTGHPVRVSIETGHLTPCTQEEINYAEEERQRLIEAWENKGNVEPVEI